MINKLTISKESLFFISIFIITIFITCLPMLSRQLPIGDDWEYHLLRIESIKVGVLSGQFPVKVNPIFFNNFGYGSSLFYPDLFLYIPAFLRIIGFGIEASYKLFIIIITILCFISAYYSGMGIIKSKYTALTISIIYCMSQYRLTNIYTRFALGEVQAFIFLPLLVYGLYNLFEEEFDKPWLLIISFSGLLYCHIISFLITVIFSIIIIIIKFKYLTNHPLKLKRLFVSFFIFLGFTASFWIPLLEQMNTNPLRTQSSRMMRDFAVSIPSIFGNNYSMTSGNNIPIGISITLLCLFRLMLINKEISNNKKLIDEFLVLGFILLFIASDLFPWNKMPIFFENIQFPWRLYGLSTTFLSFAAGITINEVFQKSDHYLLITFLLIFMSYTALSIEAISAKYYNISNDYYNDIKNTYPGNGYEYLPDDLNSSSIYELTAGERKILSDTDQEISFEQIGVKLKINYFPYHKYINIPLLYYKGYSAIFFNDKGYTINLNIINYNNLIQLDTTSIYSNGIIVIDYVGTNLQHLSYFISIIVILLYIMNSYYKLGFHDLVQRMRR